MPIPKDWGQEEKEEYIAQVTELREELDLVETDEGAENVRRIYVDLDDINPAMESRFPIRFRASKHRNASWIHWLNAIEHLGFKCKDDPNVLIGTWLHIRMEPMSSEINGNLVEWQFPRPLAVLTSEAAAQKAFEELPKVVVVKDELDTETKMNIFGLYQSLASLADPKPTFEQAVKGMLPEGMTAEQAWKLAEGIAEVEAAD
jgi:hypothetical protein